MAVKLLQWGNSTGLRIPLPLLQAAGLKPGSLVTVRLLDSGDIQVRPVAGSIPADLPANGVPATVAVSPVQRFTEDQW